MSAVIAPLLSDYLSAYFSNFDKSKLSIGAFATSLDDLHFRTDVLNQFNIPFKIIGGKVGSLYLDVGVTTIPLLLATNRVVTATLKNVNILVGPQNAVPYDKEKVEKDELKQKRTQLESLAEKRKNAIASAGTAESGPGYFQNLAIRVINNIKLNIENIHIRYEDDSLTPRTPFSFGLILTSLDAETTNAKYQPATIDKDPTFYKLLQLKSIGLYWNSHDRNLINTEKSVTLDKIVQELQQRAGPDENKSTYVAGPLDMGLKAMVTMHPQKLEIPFSKPKAEVEFDLPLVTIGLSNEQLQEGLILAQSIESMRSALPYRKYRPSDIPYKGHYKQWWKFALDCVKDQLRKKEKSQWTLYRTLNTVEKHPEIVKRVEEYTKLYPKIADGSVSAKEKKRASELENEMDNPTIMNIRLPFDLIAYREKKKITENTGTHFWSKTYVLTDADRKAIEQQAMTKEENEILIANFNDLYQPSVRPTDIDYTEYKGNVRLRETILNILNKFKDNDITENVMKLLVDGVNVSGETHPVNGGFKVDVAVGKVDVAGVKENGKPVAHLLKIIDPKTGTDDINEKPFISAIYEKKPFDSKAGSRVKIASQGFDLMYDRPTVQKIIDTFSWPKEVELTKTKAAVMSTYTKIKQKSVDNIKEMVKDTTEMEVDVQAIAPRILIPQNGQLSENASVLIISLGILTVKSVPRNGTGTGEFDLKNIAEIGNTEQDISPNILKLAYNQFNIKLADFEMLMALAGETIEVVLDEKLKSNFPISILEKGHIVVGIDQSLIANDTRFPSIKIDVDIPVLKVNVREDRMLQLVRLVSTYKIPKLTPVKQSNSDRAKDSEINIGTDLVKGIAGALTPAESRKIDGAASKKDNDPENATQQTNLLCTIHVEGIKLIVSKIDEEMKVAPVFDILISEIDGTFRSATLGDTIKASLHEISITYSNARITGYEGPINLFSTYSDYTSNKTFLKAHVFLLNDFWNGTAMTVKKQVDIEMTSLNFILHQESLVDILNTVQRIKNEIAIIQEERRNNEVLVSGGSGNISTGKLGFLGAPPHNGTKGTTLKVYVVLDGISIQLSSEKERIAEMAITFLLCDFEDRVEKSRLHFSLDGFEVSDMGSASKYSKILKVTSESEKLIDMQLTLFKVSRKTTDPAKALKLSIGSARLIMIGSFFAKIKGFLDRFNEAKKVIANASSAIGRKALGAVKDEYKKNKLNVNVEVEVGSPEILIRLNDQSSETVIIALGQLKVKNKLSQIGNTLFDDISMQLKGTRISRGLLNQFCGIVAESVYLEPFSVEFEIVRNISSSDSSIPDYKITINIPEPQSLEISVLDIQFAVNATLNTIQTFTSSLFKPIPGARTVQLVGVGNPQSRMDVVQQLRDVDYPDSYPQTWILSLQLSIKKIGVKLFTGQTSLVNGGGSIPRNANDGVGELALQNVKLSGDLRNSKEISLTFVLNSILFVDSRPGSKGVTDFLQPKVRDEDSKYEELPMVEIQLKHIIGTKSSRIIDVDYSSRSVEVVLRLDFLTDVINMVKDVISSVQSFINEVKESIGTISDEKSPKYDDVDSTPSDTISKSITAINGKIRLYETTVYLLEDASSTQTNAIALSVTGLIDMKSSEEGEFHGEGGFKLKCGTTNYATKNTIQPTQIIREAAIQIKVDRGKEDGMKVEVELPELIVRFSTGTLLLFRKIVKAVKASFTLQRVGLVVPNETDYSTVWNIRENKDRNYSFLKSETNNDRPHISGRSDLDINRVVTESLKANLKTFDVSLETGAETKSIEMIKVIGSLGVELTNWSTDLIAVGNIGLSVAYNNTRSGGWEFLLEPVELPASYGDPNHRPWQLKFHLEKPVATIDYPQTTTHAILYASDTMELTFSKTGISALKDVYRSFTASGKETASELQMTRIPYIFKNEIGILLTLRIEEETPFIIMKGEKLTHGDIEVASGHNVELSIDHQIGTTQNNSNKNVSVLIPEFGFNEIVNVGSAVSRYFGIHKSDNSGENYGIIVEVESKDDFSMTIIARSILKIVNEVQVEIDLLTLDGVSIGRIKSYGTFNVPVKTVYENPGGIFLKPKGFVVSPTPLKWEDLRGATRATHNWKCQSKSEKKGDSKIATLNVIGESVGATEGNGEKTTATVHNYVILIKAQVVINNLLPFNLILVVDEESEYTIYPGSGFSVFGLPESGNNEYTFTLKMNDFRGESWTSIAHVKSYNQILTPLKFTSSNSKQPICFGYMSDGETKQDGVSIHVYCPYWMVNYTGLDLSYKSSDGGSVVSHPAGIVGPILFAPQNGLGKNTLIQCPESEWSEEISLDNNTGVPNVTILKTKIGIEYELVFSCEIASSGLARIVTLNSRYFVFNTTSKTITMKESDNESNTIKVPPKLSIPFWPKGKVKRLAISLDSTEFTRDVSYNQSEEYVLKLDNKYGGVRVSNIQTQTKTMITISEFSTIDLTLLIVNDTQSETVEFNQKGETKLRPLNAGQSMLYDWDNLDTEKLLEWTGTKTDVDKVAHHPKKSSMTLGKDEDGEMDNTDFKWITFSHQLQQILLITQNNNLIETIKSRVDGSNEIASLSLELGLTAVGISLVDDVAALDILYARIGSMPAIWEYSYPTDDLYKLLPSEQNEIVEKGYQEYHAGHTPSLAQLSQYIQVDYEKMIINRYEGKGQKLLQHEERKGVQVNLKIFPSSLILEVLINLIQVDNQLDNAKYPVCIHISPLKKTATTISEVHPHMCTFVYSKQQIPDSYENSVNIAFHLEEFDLRADMRLVTVAQACFAADDEVSSKQQLEDYKADYTLTSTDQVDYFASQYAMSASSAKILFEKVELYKLKFNVTFTFATGGSIGVRSMFMGLASALGDITNVPFSIDGLQIIHTRLTMDQFLSEVKEHFEPLTIAKIATLVFQLNLLGNPVQLVEGLGHGLSTLLVDPVRSIVGGHYVDGLRYTGQGLGQVVGSLTTSVSSIVGSLGKVTDVIGLRYVLGSRGLLGGLAAVLAAPGWFFSSDMAEKVKRIREKRQLNGILKPYSIMLVTGKAITTDAGLSPDKYTWHCLIDETNILVLVTDTLDYLEVKNGDKLVAHKDWPTTLKEIQSVDSAENGILVHMKESTWGLFHHKWQPPDRVILMNDKAAEQWVLDRIKEGIKQTSQ